MNDEATMRMNASWYHPADTLARELTCAHGVFTPSFPPHCGPAPLVSAPCWNGRSPRTAVRPACVWARIASSRISLRMFLTG